MKSDSKNPVSNEPTVNVLLSIYNPNLEWLDAQILSINEQFNVEVMLQIRNDGSNDVQTILDGESINLESQEHLGVGGSYMDLLSKCDMGGFSFCDQDDIWNQHKLSSQIQALDGLNVPAMAYCDFQIIDSESRKIGDRKSPRKLSKFSFLFRNNIPGFSMYFNDEARKLLIDSKEFLPMNAYHDWWCAIAISQLGTCINVPQELVSYRIHGNNTVGISANPWIRLRKLKIKIQLGQKETEKNLLQTVQFIKFHNSNHESINFLREILNGMRLSRRQRLLILIQQGVLRSTISDVFNSVLLYVLPSRLKI
jgi:hypothetical protein